MAGCATEAGARVTKLAFTEPPLPTHDSLPPRQTMESGDIEQIMGEIWLEPVVQSRLPFLLQERAITNTGEFWRFYAVTTGDMDNKKRVLPHVYGSYMTWVALHFSTYNGTFGGERSYFLPEDIVEAAGMLHLGDETQIVERDGRLAGGIKVGYGVAGQIAFRQVHSPDHPQVQQALVVAQAIREGLGDDLEQYRVPYTQPPAHLRRLMTKYDLKPLEDGPYLEYEPHDLLDFLPPAFR